MINIYKVDYDALAEAHYEAVREHIGKSRSYKVQDYDDYFQMLDPGLDLRQVITAKPDELKRIKELFAWGPHPSCVYYMLTMYEAFASGQQSYLGAARRRYNAIALIESLGIRVCPLCNRNHISNADRPRRGKKRTSQMDHFYGKAQYPFLAVSFFNLVPSCPSCNHTKGTDELDLSPYDSVDLDPLIRFGFNVEDVDFIMSERELKVSLTVDPSIRRNADHLGLESLYTIHNDVAFEVLEKYRFYDALKRLEIMEDFEGLYRSEAEIQQVLFGDYADRNRLKKQALSKLKKDMLETLERLAGGA